MIFRVLVLLSLAFANGCGGDGSIPAHQSATPFSSVATAPASDPLQELRDIMEAGKQKIPIEERSTFVSASMDVIKTSSLVVPYVGQILSEWDDGTSGGLVVVYYKYENGQWTPVWANRGARGGVFPGTLRAGKALLTEDGISRREVPDEWEFPWPSTTTYRFRIWDPSAP